jgi:hypothetical protein
MRRHSPGVTLNATQKWVMILPFAFILPLFTAANSSALSLEPVVSDVISLLSPNRTTPESPRTDANPSAKNENKPPNAAKPESSPVGSIQQSTTDITPPEAPIIADPLAELPTIDVSSAQVAPRHVPVVAHRAATTVASGVLGVAVRQPMVPLQSSNQGWKLFGITWYWWVICAGSIYYVSRRLVGSKLRKLLNQKPITG